MRARLDRSRQFLILGSAVLLGVLGLLGSCGGGEGPTPELFSGDARSVLYVVDNAGTVLSFDDANSASGTSAPDRILAGLASPRGIAVDMARNELYVAEAALDRVAVYSRAHSASGIPTPIRTIDSTDLVGPSALFLDVVRDRLYVTSTTTGAGSPGVVVFSNASGTTAIPAQAAVLAGPLTTFDAPLGLAVDMLRDRLYVANSGNNAILAFNGASQLTGSAHVAPNATITSAGAGALSSPSGIFSDALNDRLYVANSGGNSVLAFAAASAVSGARSLTPTVIGSGALNNPRDVFLDLSTDRLYVANDGADNVVVFNGARTASSTTRVARTIGLPAGTVAFGTFIDVTPVVTASDASLDGQVDSNGTVITAGGGPRVGDDDTFLGSTAFRQFYSFDLPQPVTGIEVASAGLRVFQGNVEGSPYLNLGNVVVDHVNYGATLSGASYAGGTIATGIGVLSASAAVEYKPALDASPLDVTDRVRVDLDSGRVRSQYRLRFAPTEANSDTSADFAQFTDAEDSCCAMNKPPLLLITFAP